MIKRINWRDAIFLIVIYFTILTFYQGYYPYFPSIPVYPKNEIEQVVKSINTRTQEDVDFFYKTNHGVHFAFLPFVNENASELRSIIDNPFTKLIIFSNKYLINRARPEQIDKSIKPLNKDTAKTPAYPAGHAFQAYLLYKKLSKKYPDKEKLLLNLAFKCDYCRIKAGLHYPSDGEYSRQLVNIFYK